MKIEVRSRFDAIEVRFNDVLHAWIVRSKLIGVQSWRRGEQNYFIEFTCADGTILCEYDDPSKWKTILDQLSIVLAGGDERKLAAQ